MRLNGIQDLIPFLLEMRKRGIHCRLDSMRDDSVMVTLTLIGARVELDFFEDHIEFSAFKGSEAVEDAPELLFRLLDEHWGDD